MGYIENCHKAPTFLEKGDEKKKFLVQSEIDQAWADGWYAPGRPDSAEKQVPKSLDEMTKKELVDIAEDKIEDAAKMKKDELLFALKSIFDEDDE